MINTNKPKYPERKKHWKIGWNKVKRSEMEPDQLEALQKYDREMRAFHRQNPEKKQRDLETYRKHVKNNKEKVYKRNSKWRKGNWDAVYRQRKESGQLKKHANRWYHNRGKHDINHVLTERLRCRIRNTITKGYKSTSTMVLLGCDIETFKTYLQSQFIDGMSWDNYGKWHIDHIKPCCSFDLSLEENQKECFHYSNLRPLWGYENIQKSKEDRKKSIKKL